MNRGPDPSPIPPQLGHSPFTSADARAAGVGRARLRAKDLEQRIHGVRGLAGSADLLVERCRLFAARLPSEAFFSHQTAALVLGCPLPWALEEAPEVHVTVPSPKRAPHAKGLVGHSFRVIEGDVIMRHGLRISAPARAWCELGTALELPDLVAVGDHLIHHRLPLVDREELAARARAGDRAARTRLLRQAHELLSDRSESRPESRLRVILARGGLPEPQINHVVISTTEGNGVRTDFAYPDMLLAIEYQGDYHRSKNQWRKDMTRRMRLEALGWYVLELNADDLRNPADLCERVWAIINRRSSPG